MTKLDRLIDRLELKEFQLKALLDITKAINANVEQEELLHLYEGIVRKQLGITRLMLFQRQDRWECILSYGTQAKDTDVDVERVFGSFTDIQGIPTEHAGGLGSFDVAVPVYHLERPLAFLLIGDIDEDQQRMSPSVKHLNFIQTLTNLIVVAMENRRLAKQALQQERDKRELELAAEMQSMLIPQELPGNAQFEAAAWYQPHRQVGGDYYDLFFSEKGELVVVIADVSGKGMAAALLMSNFQATLRALIQYSSDPLHDLVHDLNDKVFRSARGERFITFFIGIIEASTGHTRFVNAGHNAPLLLHRQAITELATGSIALGMMPKLPFLKVGECTIGAGDTLLCYTDGLVEQENIRQEALDLGPVRKALAEFGGTGAHAVNTAVVTAFEAHRDGQPYLDDIALLTCRFR